MIEEMSVLHALVPVPPGKSIVGCRWIYVVKVGLNGRVDQLKDHLLAEGYI